MEVVLKRVASDGAQEFFVHADGERGFADAVADTARTLGFTVTPRRCPATFGNERIITTVDEHHDLQRFGTIVFIQGNCDVCTFMKAMLDILDSLVLDGYGWMAKAEWDERLSRAGGTA